MIKISVSSSNNLRSCKRKFYFSKTLPFKRNLNLIYGTCFEKSFEVALTQGLEKGIEEGFRSFKKQKAIRVHAHQLIEKGTFSLSKLRKDINECKALLPDMVERLYDFVLDNDIKFITNQCTVNYTLPNGNIINGRFDGLIEYQGKKYIFELKGYSSLKEVDDLIIDNQVLNYLLLASRTKLDVEGLMFCQLKKALPKEPKIIKNGKEMSTDKSQKCDPETYLEYAQNVYDVIPDKIMEFYEYLKTKPNDLLQLDVILPNNQLIDEFESQMTVISEEMAELLKLIKDNPKEAFRKCYTNRGNDCSWCNYTKECKKGEC